MPVIYTTGAQGHERAPQGVANSMMIAKPFAMAQLVDAVTLLPRHDRHC